MKPKFQEGELFAYNAGVKTECLWWKKTIKDRIKVITKAKDTDEEIRENHKFELSFLLVKSKERRNKNEK